MPRNELIGFIIRRSMQMILTLLSISILSFVVMQLPSGDFVSHYLLALESRGQPADLSMAEGLRERYGLDKPLYVQYLRWIWGIVRGDFGYSFAYGTEVADIIGKSLRLTVSFSLTALLFTWVLAFPIGIYSATHQYSIGDYSLTLLGFLGLAIPNFLLALVMMWLLYSVMGWDVTGLFSPRYVDAPWSFLKVLDLAKHMALPVFVVGMSGTAALMRTFRANLLDEIRKPYVDAALAKGIPEKRVLYKYPVRIALIPFVSTMGWSLPHLVSGAVIVSVVINLPTTGPILLNALRSQDTYLSGAIIMLLGFLTVVGTLLSDILLAWLDPRIRLE